MLQQTEIENWNSLFPNCQIRTSDLKNPTEYFLTKALVAYLNIFGYKVEPPTINFNNDNNKEYRAFLIKLARHTDYMLKICRKALSFTYYDLINPTPKKTSHTLSILLNYLVYYNWFKDDVFNIARGKLNEYKELTAEIEENKRNNDRLVKVNTELQEAIKALEKELPKIQEECATLKEKVLIELNRTEKLQASVKELKEKEQELKKQQDLLNKNIVADDESKELQLERENLKKDIDYIEREQNKCQKDLVERDDVIKERQGLSKDIKKATEVFSKQVLEKWKLSDELLGKARTEVDQLKVKRNEVQDNIKELKQKKQIMQNLIRAKKNEIENERKGMEEKIARQRQLLDENYSKKQLFQDEQDTLDHQIKELRHIEEFLYDNIKKIKSYDESYNQ